jgi:hypothetical protein
MAPTEGLEGLETMRQQERLVTNYERVGSTFGLVKRRKTKLKEGTLDRWRE